MARPKLSVKELTELLMSRSHMSEERASKLKEHLGESASTEAQGLLSMFISDKQRERLDKLTHYLNKWTAERLAERLYEDNRSIPLFVQDDVDDYIPIILHTIEQDVKEIQEQEKDPLFPEEEDRMDAAERQMLGVAIKASIGNLMQSMADNTGEDFTQYDKLWHWVHLVQDLAAAKGISPVEYIKLEDSSDEITRRLYSREDYIIHMQKVYATLLDIDVIKKGMSQPLMDMLGSLTQHDEETTDEEKSILDEETDDISPEELMKTLEEMLFPKLQEALDAKRVKMEAWIYMEANRMYGPI